MQYKVQINRRSRRCQGKNIYIRIQEKKKQNNILKMFTMKVKVTLYSFKDKLMLTKDGTHNFIYPT